MKFDLALLSFAGCSVCLKYKVGKWELWDLFCPYSRRANRGQGSAVDHDISLWFKGVKLHPAWSEVQHKIVKIRLKRMQTRAKLMFKGFWDISLWPNYLK